MSWYSDPHPVNAGYWGPITSTLLWCEEKYVHSYYIAEPVNTVTNLFFIALSLYGFRSARREKLPTRTAVSHLGVAFIGLGSALFHGTLKYSMQLMDELPMIYTSAFLTYCVVETSKGYGNPRFRLLLPLTLIGLVIFITVAYIWSGNPVFHQVAYASIQLVSTARVISLLRNPKSPLNTTAKGLAQKAKLKRLYRFGCTIFILAFAIWNMDNIFCYRLRQMRRQVGYPLAVLLEGHGWWHILTGWGAYCIITAGSQLALSYKEEPENFELQGEWIPIVKRVKAYKPTTTRRKKQ